MEGTHLLSLVTFLPLVGGLLLLLFGAEEKEWIRRGALAISVVTFVISLLLLREFDSQAPGYQYQEMHRWIISPPIWYHLGIDGLSLWLVILTTFLVPLAVLCSCTGLTNACRNFTCSCWRWNRP